MPAQITTLGKCFLTGLALEWSLASVLPKVIPKVAAFFEHAATAWVLALEVQLDSLGVRIFDTYRLVPLLRDSFKSFVLVST